MVSIHAPTRGATLQGTAKYRGQQVSIHAPTRGATHHRGWSNQQQQVSIHAPTRGATSIIQDRILGSGFQSTHPHGVRRKFPFLSRISIGFNPRTHTGCDATLILGSRDCKVSIHAPTRGATGRNNSDRGCYQVSIHAPTRGATL